MPPQVTIPAMDDADRFADLACLSYSQIDGPQRWAEAEALLRNDPTLTRRSLAAAAAAGDSTALRALLVSNASTATRTTGPRSWSPLLYACYSRVSLPGSRSAACVGELLRHGADPNSREIKTGGYPFTALTGVIGGGEQGPLRQPAHRDWRTLAEQLLGAGADPNDSQAVYNRHFETDDDALRILLAHGLKPTDRLGWPVAGKDGVSRPSAVPTLTFLLPHAITNGRLARVELLLAHGVLISGVDLPYGERRSIPELVALSGDATMRALFERHGIVIPTLTGVDGVIAAVQSGDAVAAATQARTLGNLAAHAATLAPVLCQAAARGRVQTVTLLLDLGVPVDGIRAPWTPLHQAAWHGHLAVIEVLLTRGADRSLLDHDHQATAAQWAAFNHQSAAATRLAAGARS